MQFFCLDFQGVIFFTRIKKRAQKDKRKVKRENSKVLGVKVDNVNKMMIKK